MDFRGFLLRGIILNYIGGTVRWIYGSCWRLIFNKEKYCYDDYIHGPDKSSDHFDKYGHQFNNRFIGIVFIIIVFIIINRFT